VNGIFDSKWFKGGILVVLLAIIASFGYKLWANADSGSNSLRPLKDAKGADIRQYIPSFELQSADGRMVKSSEFDGKVKLVYFFFSNCPDVCPMTTQYLAQVQEEMKKNDLFGAKANILSISFDPQRDTPERLKQFSQSYGADPSGWVFMRGQDEASIKSLAEKFGVGVIKDEKGNFMHTNVVFLVDKHGVIRADYDAQDPALKPEMIVKDMKKIAKES
jgi:protein SCO1